MAQLRERPQAGARGQTENMASIKKIGVIGAGQMGNGIAHVAARTQAALLAHRRICTHGAASFPRQSSTAPLDADWTDKVAAGRPST